LSVVHPNCCGLDVHKKVIAACMVLIDEFGNETTLIEEFGTFTDELEDLRDWLLEHECPIVAMESTGIYWRPIHNILESTTEIILVNARHIKNVPGRKTDIADSKWLAGLLQHGLLKGSYIPEKEVRQWRELSRARRKNRDTISDYKRRTHKLFESANIKIDSVVSNLFGVTGRNLMALLLSGATAISIADIEFCAKGTLRDKVAELHRSIQGFFEGHHRFQLNSLLNILEILEEENAQIDQRMKELMQEHDDLLNRMDAVPGINTLSA